MKRIIYPIALSLIVLLSACSNSSAKHAPENSGRYMADQDIEDDYLAFLQGNKEINNPFVENDFISFYLEEEYWEVQAEIFPPDSLRKYYVLQDMTGDGKAELLYKVSAGVDEIICIIGRKDSELVIYDIFETHTNRMGSQIYEDGTVEWGQNYAGEEITLYRYDQEGLPRELIHFNSSDAWLEKYEEQSDFYPEYYYLNGIESELSKLADYEEYQSLLGQYRSTPVNWIDLDDFQDINIIRQVE